MQLSHLNPARLPLGTRVGPWLVLERRGLGVYGAVYRAIHAQTPSGPVALKLALHPWDERFTREAELLSRIRHPCVPRLIDQGVWLHPDGLGFPFLAMELIDGVPLYQWALEQRPSSRQVLHVLACLARALEATHSVNPEARGSARELAEALEAAAHEAGPEADGPLFVPETPRPAAAPASQPHVVPPAPGRSRRPWHAAVGLGGALAALTWGLLSAPLAQQSEKVLAEVPEEENDGGTIAVGDSTLTAPVSTARAPSAWSAIAVEVPSKPFPGQRRPDGKGRCPGRLQVPINGGCWILLTLDPKDCDKEDAYYVHQGRCYTPAFSPARPPTSSPTDRADAPP
jgi:hypothetical protein